MKSHLTHQDKNFASLYIYRLFLICSKFTSKRLWISKFWAAGLWKGPGEFRGWIFGTGIPLAQLHFTQRAPFQGTPTGSTTRGLPFETTFWGQQWNPTEKYAIVMVKAKIDVTLNLVFKAFACFCQQFVLKSPQECAGRGHRKDESKNQTEHHMQHRQNGFGDQDPSSRLLLVIKTVEKPWGKKERSSWYKAQWCEFGTGNLETWNL